MNKKQIGDIGEDEAVKFLETQKGYIILKRNYRFKRAEIDIIAQKENVIHFIEVKKRKNAFYGYPEEFVGEKKMEMLRVGAEGYILERDWQGDLQFDIVAITGRKIELLEDVS